MGRRPWYKRFPSNWLGGVIMLTAEERGVYDTLLELMYDRWATIRHEPKELARICGTSLRRFNVIFDKLVQLKKVTLVDGMISNERFEIQRGEEGNEAETFAENGRKSGKKRRDKSAENEPGLFETNELAKKGFEHTRVQTPDDRYQKPSGKHRLPESWYPSADGYAYAERYGFDRAKAENMFDKFRRHHIAKGSTWANWDMVWQNWVRQEVEFAASRRPANGETAQVITMADIASGKFRRTP